MVVVLVVETPAYDEDAARVDGDHYVGDGEVRVGERERVTPPLRYQEGDHKDLQGKYNRQF